MHSTGFFALNLDDSSLGLSAAALAPLLSLPNLGWLAVDAKDDWMPYINEMPRLRFLGAQDTTAGDDGLLGLWSYDKWWGTFAEPHFQARVLAGQPRRIHR